MAKGRGDTVEKLFSPKRQYEIPIYQRRYVWGIENWDSLWTDIKEKFDSRSDGEQSTSHFTGIIITRKDEKGQGLPKYQILDGQQRLTTFQILLCVIRDLCKSKNYTLRSDSADLLVKNEGYNEEYKLYPKEGFDEEAFRALVDSEPRGDHVIHRAYNHFMDAITNDIGTDSPNIDHLYNAITNDFHMVQIDLKKGDEPEKIFASLNATGRMLDEFDHLRNDLFLKAGDAGTNLYDTCWSHFDIDSYWEDPENLDRFLRHFLQATVNPECFQTQEGEEVKAFDVYLKQYRSKLQPDQDIEYEFRKLKKYSKVYQEMNDPNSKIGSRMKFYKEFDIEDMFPFILFIISEFSEFTVSEDEPEREFLLSDTNLELIFDILESYMIRRMLRWGRDYHYKSIDMVNKFFYICLNEKSFSLPKFIAHLANRRPDRHQDKWSTDREVNNALTEEWHVHIEKGIRYILYRIELEIRGENSLTMDFTDALRLERIMPTRWEYSLNWQLPLEEGSDRCVPYDNIFSEEHKKNNKLWRKADPSEEGLVDQSYSYALDLAKKRRKHQKSIGNLTLVDVEIDTDEFTEKKPYFEDFHLEINEVIYASENWDAPQIEERAEKLLPYFHKLWPSSSYFIETYLSEKYSVGSKVQGKVVDITNSGVTLQLEKGIEGWIHVSEMGWTHSVDPSGIVSIDDEIEAVVIKIINPTDAIRISLSMKPFQPNPWQKYSIDTELTGTIKNITDYCMFIEIEEGINGRIDYSKPSWLNQRIACTLFKEGDKIKVIVRQINASKRRMDLDFKCLPQNPWELLEQKYPIGSKVSGQIRRITNYGVFVEVEGGIDGLLHNTELSWTKWNMTAEDVFEVDEKVEVVILEIDTSKQHVRLGFKQLQPNPWESIGQKYPIGMRITGRIRKLTKSGAYVEVEEGITGLIRNSDLSWTNKKVTASKLFEVNDKVKVVVLQIEESQKLILLGFKQLQPNPWEGLEQKYSVGTKVTGRIRELTSFGAFVEIEMGIDGLIHISELTDQEIEKPEEVVSIGEKLDVKVINISVEDRKIGLSLKAVKADEPMTAITYSGQTTLPQIIKSDILFSCSGTAWKTLKDLVEIRKDVKKRSLSPIKSKKKILSILDSLLFSAREKKVTSIAITRVGHELYGTIENFNSNEIEMRISGKIVTVYRHGLIEFATTEVHRGKVTEFNNNKGTGFIQSNELPRISVSISEVWSESTVQLTGRTVEFEIHQTLHGLEAHNVVSMEK